MDASEFPQATLALHVPDEGALAQLATQVAPRLQGSEFVAISGPLGAGKTSFVRALLRALGHVGIVRSPTFTLVEPYSFARMEVLHLDLYRLKTGAQELEMLGVREQFGAAVILIEWPENGAPWLPTADLEMRFDYAEHGRSLHATASTAAGEVLLAALGAASAVVSASSAASSISVIVSNAVMNS